MIASEAANCVEYVPGWHGTHAREELAASIDDQVPELPVAYATSSLFALSSLFLLAS